MSKSKSYELDTRKMNTSTLHRSKDSRLCKNRSLTDLLGPREEKQYEHYLILDP